MRMMIQNGFIYLKDPNPAQLLAFKGWGGLLKFDRRRDYWYGTQSLDLLNRLAQLVRLPESAEAIRQDMLSLHNAIDSERMAEKPVPLVKYPVKLDMFAHQVRGANMALLTFGFADPSEVKA